MIEENIIITEEEFKEAFKQHFQPLFAYAVTLLRDQHSAEEIVQEMFYRIWLRRNEMQINRSFRAYLYQTVHNDCMNYLKHKKVKSKYVDYLSRQKETTETNGATNLMNKEVEQRFLNALQQLPEKCRTIFQMSRYEEMKYREIASHLNLSVKTIENQMGKALRILRTQLADYLPFFLLIIISIFIKNLKP